MDDLMVWHSHSVRIGALIMHTSFWFNQITCYSWSVFFNWSSSYSICPYLPAEEASSLLSYGKVFDVLESVRTIWGVVLASMTRLRIGRCFKYCWFKQPILVNVGPWRLGGWGGWIAWLVWNPTANSLCIWHPVDVQKTSQRDWRKLFFEMLCIKDAYTHFLKKKIWFSSSRLRSIVSIELSLCAYN